MSISESFCLVHRVSSKTARATERNAALKNQHTKLADVRPLTHIQQRTARSWLSEKMHLSLKRLEAPGSGVAWWVGGWGGADILVETEGGEEVWDGEQSEGGPEGVKNLEC